MAKRTPARPRPRRLGRRPGLERLESRQLLAAFSVTSNADTNTAGTLRYALSNLTAGASNSITFNLPSGQTTITPGSQLPTISAPVTIDATTEPGYGGTPLVTINGASSGAGLNGFSLNSAGVTLKGLAIVGFGGAAVSIGAPGGDAVSSCYIGVTAAGNAAQANDYGIFVLNSSNNTIGGASAAAGDVISGNTVAGVYISGKSSTGNTVGYDRIGTDASGTAALANGNGVFETQGTGNVFAYDQISGNSNGGILLESGSSNVILGLTVGTNAAGTAAVANGSYGVFVNAETGTSVGAAGAANANLISGNAGPGVVISASTNCSLGNSFVGLNRAGTAALPNQGDGVDVTSASAGTTIGGGSGLGNFIAGNAGSNNAGNGIHVAGLSTGTLIQGDVIGSDTTGQVGIPNSQNGVLLDQVPATIRLCSIIDNTLSGIYLLGGSGSTIQVNRIGDLATGTHGNKVDGIFIYGSSNNTIGGTNQGNVISANGSNGVEIQSQTGSKPVASQNNVIQGNFIGLTTSGAGGRGNQIGVYVVDSPNNTIGGTSFGAINDISSNSLYGVAVSGTASAGTLISGNFIGTDATGSTAAPNSASGVDLYATSNVTVQQNVISGNTVDGVYVQGGYSSTIRNNLIGIDATGFKPLGNGGNGVDIAAAAAILVGGGAGTDRNTIANNGGNGVQVAGAGANGNVIGGNWIGYAVDGKTAMGNGGSGVLINNAANNTVGGIAASYNFIGNNKLDGVQVVGSGATGSAVTYNVVGLGVDGVTPAGDGIDGVYVSAAAGSVVTNNYISENTQYGVHVLNATTATIANNLIGTDLTGKLARGNAIGGVLLENTSRSVVGGTSTSARNVISGNGYYGVFLLGPNSTGNSVAANIIGLNIAGTGGLGNGSDGVLVQAPGNTVGGTSGGARNIISANGFAGVHLIGGATGNLVANDWIGTNAGGNVPIGNSLYGIFVDGTGSASAAGNAALQNVISGNGYADVNIAGTQATGTVVQGNLVGTDPSGTFALAAPPYGIAINGAPNNTIGGGNAGQGNVISGHATAGVAILNTGASGNLVVGNLIGRAAGANPSLANALGVLINNAPNNTVGGTAGQSNTITGNTTNTISVTGSGATGNQTSNNVIGS